MIIYVIFGIFAAGVIGCKVPERLIKISNNYIKVVYIIEMISKGGIFCIDILMSIIFIGILRIYNEKRAEKVN